MEEQVGTFLPKTLAFDFDVSISRNFLLSQDSSFYLMKKVLIQAHSKEIIMLICFI